MPLVSIFSPPFGGRVRRDAGPRHLALQRADVDDLAVAARYHPAGDLAADQEGGGEVRGEQEIPVLISEFAQRRAALRAGVVHQDVERARDLLGAGDAVGDGLG
jgi:hypothetical protein